MSGRSANRRSPAYFTKGREYRAGFCPRARAREERSAGEREGGTPSMEHISQSGSELGGALCRRHNVAAL